MRRQTFVFVAIVLPLVTAFAAAQASSALPVRRAAMAQAAPAATTVRPAGLDLSALDPAVAACTDFYQYACGGWMAANPMPADRQRWGRFNQLQERNFEVLRTILETPSADAVEQKAGDYYRACMDERGIESKGLAPLAADLARIASLTRVDELPAVVVSLHRIGVSAFFQFGVQTDLRDATRQLASVDQGGLGLPDRDYYMKTDEPSRILRQKYQGHVARMLELLGDDAGRATANAQAVLALETKLAQASLGRAERRDPAATDHVMTLAAWRALTPTFDWTRYVAAAGAPAFTRLNVRVPDYLKAMARCWLPNASDRDTVSDE